MAKSPTAPLAQDNPEILWVALSDAVLWDLNPKRHDIAGIMASIRRHGWKNWPVYDKTLGAIPAGNGRFESLRLMKAAGENSPRGVKVREDGEWIVPLQSGIDSSSPEEAAAFAIDDNNLVPAGGGGGQDALRDLWDAEGMEALLAGFGGAEGPDTMEWETFPGLEPVKEPGEGKRTSQVASGGFVRPVLAVSDVETVERALRATGIMNRGAAFVAICEAFLAAKG